MEDELESTIRAQVDEWSTNSNDCFTIELLRGDGTAHATFEPEFTYPIFGEEEAIFGYQGLEIKLTFAAHNLQPHLGVSYEQRFKAIAEVKPTDIHDALREFLPESAFAEEAVPEEGAFRPPGEKVHEWTRDGQIFEVWCASLTDPDAKQILENMQILAPLFIEGGSVLQLEQDWTTQRWKLFLLYAVETEPQTYSLVGYGTSYRIFSLPEKSQTDTSTATSLANILTPPSSQESPLDLPSRERLSQFLILPPFQKSGHGAELYNAMYRTLTKPENVHEFTVEDPNEAFDDLRDLCDLLYLRAHDADFAALRVNTSVPASALDATAPIPVDQIVSLSKRDEIRRRTKITQRQFDRLVEMHLLSFIPPLHRSRARITQKERSSNENDRAFYFWRLLVKQRLYLHNRDLLAQVERVERIERVEAALDSVLEAYGQLAEKVVKREQEREGSLMAVEGASQGKRAKRKVIEEDEDEDEEMVDGANGSVNGNGIKRAKV